MSDVQKKWARAWICGAAITLLFRRGDCCCGQEQTRPVPKQPEARRLEVGMALDQALAMFAHDRIECHEYFISAVPEDGSYDVRFYIVESKASRDALMITAYQKSKDSSRIIRCLTWYHDWTTLRGLRGSECVRGTDS